jgi:predicted nucleic acid-binding protein
VRRVVSNTSPILYLHLIQQIEVLPLLFRSIYLPAPVFDELSHKAAPSAVREWAASLPAWISISPVGISDDPGTLLLDGGERSAIELAGQLKAELILMDDRRGVRAALQKGFEVTGTLGILDLAARRGLIDLADSFDRLRATNFRYRPEMMQAILDAFGPKK